MSLLLLGACQNRLFSGSRDMERLRPVQTLGLDRAGAGVELSVSTGAGPDGAPALVMSARASGIEPAITRLQDYSPQDELFYAHVRYILLGEDMAEQGVLSLLDWVERSPSMRMGTPLLLVKGRAAEAVTGASGEMTDATERLASLEREELSRGRHIYTLREVASSLLEQGGALCLTLEALPSEDVVHTPGEGGRALLPAGYAVLRPGEAPVWLTEGESLGAELLQKGLAGARVPLEGCALEILRGSARAEGIWEGEELTGLAVSCELTAGILERPEGAAVDTAALETALEEAARNWLTAVIRRAQAMHCDFLALRGPASGGLLRPGPSAAGWQERFPLLSLQVTAEARIDRSYDLSEG